MDMVIPCQVFFNNMYGYIYKTTNLINNKVYIGKHKSPIYDDKYYGSGKILLLAIKKYGISNFKNEIIQTCDTLEELNIAEKYYINLYKSQYKKDDIYNIAKGGDGGDTLSNKTVEEKDAFKEKMKKINKERCNAEEFKRKISEAGIKRYENIEERKKQSEKIKKAWANPELREKQSLNMLLFLKNNPGYFKGKNNCGKPCVLEYKNKKIRFSEISELKLYLKNELNYSPSDRTLYRLFREGEQKIPYKAFHKKFERLNGMLIYLENKGVETMDDECNPVEEEIGTSSKCKTEIEEIVQFV